MNGYVLLIGLIAPFIYAAELETSRYYRIQCFDGSYMTIGGDNSADVKVITEDVHGSDPRQTFWIGDGPESHVISPRAQNAFSSLRVGVDMKSSLVFQQRRSLGARYQWWMIHQLSNSTWSLQNVRTGLCMSTEGNNTQIFVTLCDRSSTNQSWTLTPYTIKLSTPAEIAI